MTRPEPPAPRRLRPRRRRPDGRGGWTPPAPSEGSLLRRALRLQLLPLPVRKRRLSASAGGGFAKVERGRLSPESPWPPIPEAQTPAPAPRQGRSHTARSTCGVTEGTRGRAPGGKGPRRRGRGAGRSCWPPPTLRRGRRSCPRTEGAGASAPGRPEPDVTTGGPAAFLPELSPTGPGRNGGETSARELRLLSGLCPGGRGTSPRVAALGALAGAHRERVWRTEPAARETRPRPGPYLRRRPGCSRSCASCP